MAWADGSGAAGIAAGSGGSEEGQRAAALQDDRGKAPAVDEAASASGTDGLRAVAAEEGGPASELRRRRLERFASPTGEPKGEDGSE